MNSIEVILHILLILISIGVIIFSEGRLSNSSWSHKSNARTFFTITSIVGFILFIFSIVKIAIIVIPNL